MGRGKLDKALDLFLGVRSPSQLTVAEKGT